MSDFLGAAERNASSRMGSMGIPEVGRPNGDQGKRAMGDVHYRAADSAGGGPMMAGGPAGGPEGPGAPSTVGGGRCGDCEYFDGQMTCSLVAGNIDPEATCDLFEPKSRDRVMADTAPPQGPVGGDQGGAGFAR